MKKKEKVDRTKHLRSTEDVIKSVCEKVNIDHKAAIIAAKMHGPSLPLRSEHDK